MEGAVWDSNRCLELEQPVAWVEVLAGGRGGHRRVLNNRGVKSDCCNTTIRVRHPRIRTRPPIDGLRRRLRVRLMGVLGIALGIRQHRSCGGNLGPPGNSKTK